MNSQQLPFQVISNQGSEILAHKKSRGWKSKQRICYAVFCVYFMEQYRRYFHGGKNQWDFWRKMAIFVQTKNPNQCRIYRKIILQEHPNRKMQEIILSLKKNTKEFKHWYSHYEQGLANIARCLSTDRRTNNQNGSTTIRQNMCIQKLVKTSEEKQKPEEEQIYVDQISTDKDKLQVTSSQYINYSSCVDSKKYIEISSRQSLESLDDHLDFQVPKPSSKNYVNFLACWSVCHESLMSYLNSFEPLMSKQEIDY